MIALLNNFSQNVCNLAPMSSLVSPSSHIVVQSRKELEQDNDCNSEELSEEEEQESDSEADPSQEQEEEDSNDGYESRNVHYKAIGVLVQGA